ncbi:hypothetical protein C4K00_2744 [Pseudomonas synxantha]|nr:hypothetical protein C4K00_2744 [Pseudomonas synxantha]
MSAKPWEDPYQLLNVDVYLERLKEEGGELRQLLGVLICQATI